MRPFLCALALLTISCTAKIGGDVTHGDARLVITGCHSGAPRGFAGVELVLEGGGALRVARLADGTVTTILLPPSGGSGLTAPACSTLRLETQNSTVNDVKNVRGDTTIDCTIDGRPLKGTVTFENCH